MLFRLNLGQIMRHEKKYCLFDNLNLNLFLPSSQKKHNVRPISDRVSVTEKLDLGSIPCLAFSNKKGHREDSTVCGRQNVAA